MKAISKSVKGTMQASQAGRSSIGQATFVSAVEALRANRLRSFLTMLGVIIGVSAVISVVTLTQGINQSVTNRLSGLGTNVLTISPGATTTTGARSDKRSCRIVFRMAHHLLEKQFVLIVSFFA